ncbi:hypothetical protein M426DRAFT_15102 [Hypoxylon sp. CI-4A]|nr:hypothetical protein M426DRAFT_15102 [Hypoxylon sp. CI-4A]
MLPLLIKVGIRDYWDNTDAAVQRSRCGVEETLGKKAVLDIAWESLISELSNGYTSDMSTVVPSIATSTKAFLDGLREILDTDVNLGWANTLLDSIKSSLIITITVSKNNDPTVTWSMEADGFIVQVAMGGTTLSPLEMQSLFKTKILDCFNEQKDPTNDWSHVSMNDPSSDIIGTETDKSFDILSDVSNLPSPDQLLLRPPYHLIVYGGGRTTVEVHCSHSPTLQLLADYLKKWCKLNYQDTRHPPMVEVKLHHSSFAFGLIYDRLTMSVNNRNPEVLVSPVTVLALVEGILGYQPVSTDGSSWTFRRDKGFRNP